VIKIANLDTLKTISQAHSYDFTLSTRDRMSEVVCDSPSVFDHPTRCAALPYNFRMKLFSALYASRSEASKSFKVLKPLEIEDHTYSTRRVQVEKNSTRKGEKGEKVNMKNERFKEEKESKQIVRARLHTSAPSHTHRVGGLVDKTVDQKVEGVGG
jgi:hypothetical protein